MKIVFCSSEVAPYAKTGGMADVCGSLPIALEKCGHDITIVLPRYKTIDQKKYKIKKLNKHVAVTKLSENIQVLLIEHEKYFSRKGFYGTSRGDYKDNLERFQFFCKATLDILKLLNIKADIVHCHDWQTALIPAYLKHTYHKDPFYKNTRTVLSLHNLAYQGVFERAEFEKLDLDKKLFHHDGFEFYGKINLLKGGLLYSDRVTTVSPHYAKEIQSKELGCGLEGVLHSRRDAIVGIINGLDYDYWNPGTDPLIKENYTDANLQKKDKNKSELQKDFGLPIKKNVPVFGFVGRMSYQKGIDLIEESMTDCVKENIQIVMLGVGEEKYQDKLNDLVKKYPKKVSVHLNFNEKLAHQVYAGSDFFLMPSVYEPCGLSQMISLKYATIPLVRHTGGLIDTISPFENGGNGIVFKNYNAKDFIKAVVQAVELYKDKTRFYELRKRIQDERFSWENSAKEYTKIYAQCLKE